MKSEAISPGNLLALAASQARERFAREAWGWLPLSLKHGARFLLRKAQLEKEFLTGWRVLGGLKFNKL
jgi:hypothetical protein